MEEQWLYKGEGFVTFGIKGGNHGIIKIQDWPWWPRNVFPI